MASFSASDAALEGFRLTRERPQAVLVWAAVFLVMSLVSTAVMISFAGTALADLMAAARRPGAEDADPTEMLASLGRLAPVGLVAAVIGVFFYGVLYSAVNRAILRPSEGGPGFLRFGGDELRQTGALVLFFLLFLAVYLVLVLGTVALAAAAGAVGGTAGGAVAGLLAVFIILGGAIFFLVRFSLVSPLTFGRRRIQVLESWRVTKGHFWPLLGAFVLALVLVVVVYLLGMMIFTALAALLGGGLKAAGQAFSPNYESLGAYFTPAILIYMVVSSILSALSTAILAGTAASAYQQITGEDASKGGVGSA